METSQAKGGRKESKARKVEVKAEHAEHAEHAEMAIRERVDQARDLVEDLRDRAEMAFHERPYLLPVATGVLGLGIGILIGSKVSRLLLVTAAGAMLSDSVRSQVSKISRDVLRDLSHHLEAGDDSEEDEREPAHET